MARAVQRATSAFFSDHRPLCTYTSPTIRGFCDDLAGFFIAMANFTDTDYVSNPTLNVQPLGN